MLKNKEKEEESKIKEKVAQVDQDLIVHNMPKEELGKSSSRSKETDNNSRNFKMVGALIIGLGIILVGVLIFLAYRYIINPQPKTEPAPTETSTIEEELNQDEKEVQEINATTTVEVKDPDNTGTKEETKESADEEENSEEEDETITNISLILDTDGDGLNDEEEIVLGTNINLKDTDGDGYLDLEEINNAYNPSGSGILEENENLTRYYSSLANYSFLYPINWELSTANNDYTTLVTALNNSIIQVSVQPNTKIQNILTWHQNNIPNEEISYEDLIVGSGWEGVMGEDNLNFYLTDENKVNIYVISYIPINRERSLYPNIFNLIINSFVIE